VNLVIQPGYRFAVVQGLASALQLDVRSDYLITPAPGLVVEGLVVE
jgi:hypothetical protein